MSNYSKQAKVSMVMPCYNKADYIGEMLESIIVQKWDNIELIMVNDGSTDKTREIIEQYLPKLHRRGFEAYAIDQENAGVCEAAKNGFLRVTGKYTCLVDSDDELDPEYVSLPVSFLESNPEYDYTACQRIEYQYVDNKKIYIERELRPIEDGCQTVCEMYLTEQIVMPVWAYMVRTRYLRECGIPHSYYTKTKGSHEPGYIIPLTANNGKVKFFPLALYKFNVTGEGHSRFVKYEQAEKFYEEYLRLGLIAIKRLGGHISDERKLKLVQLCHIHRYFNLFINADRFAEHDKEVYGRIIDELNRYLVESKLIISNILPSDLYNSRYYYISTIQSKIINSREYILSEKRDIVIFGAGAIGREFYKRYFDDFNFVCFVDNNEFKYGIRYWGLDVVPPSEIPNFKNIAVVVCVRNHYAIARQLFDMGIQSFWLTCDEQSSDPRYMNFDNLTLMDFSGYENINFNPKRVWLRSNRYMGGSCYAIEKFTTHDDLEFLITERESFNFKNNDDYFANYTSALVVTESADYVGKMKRFELWQGFLLNSI